MAVARGAVFETLTEVGPGGLLRGELATGWHGSADARHWQIDLRPDAVFHDGRPFTARDASATLMSRTSPVRSRIDVVRTTRGALEVTLKAGDPDFPYRLADPDLSIAPADVDSSNMDAWAGTGLYRVVTARNGRQYLGRRVDAHWKDGEAGWIDTIEVLAITDPDVRLEALRDGHVDVIEDADGLVCADHVGQPRVISDRGRLDDGRIAERWWIAG